MTGLGANDLADIIANLAGAALGTSTAVVAGWAADAIADHTVPARQWMLRGTTVAVVGVCAAVLPGPGATQRQAVLAEEARHGFNRTSLTDIHQWERDDELDRVSHGMPSTYSDGFTMGQDPATARYPGTPSRRAHLHPRHLGLGRPRGPASLRKPSAGKRTSEPTVGGHLRHFAAKRARPMLEVTCSSGRPWRCPARRRRSRRPRGSGPGRRR